MDRKLAQEIRKNFESTSTEDLLRIWIKHDETTYSEEAFEAVGQILLERGFKNLPKPGSSTEAFELNQEINTSEPTLQEQSTFERLFMRTGKKALIIIGWLLGIGWGFITIRSILEETLRLVFRIPRENASMAEQLGRFIGALIFGGLLLWGLYFYFRWLRKEWKET